MATTSVNSTNTAGGVLLLASSNRRMATITNTDANALYVLLDSGVPSSTNYTVKLATDDYFETPAAYTGDIWGIWDADGSGAAIVTTF